MNDFTKASLCFAAAFTLSAAWLPAQEKKSTPAKSKILQPQMTVETGSYAAPAGKLGDKPDQPWSSTTVGAAVDGKPNPGAMVVTRVGEIVDFSCYLQVGKHGEKHRDCAQKCLRNGQPIGLLTQDGALYMLMEEEHDPRRDGMTNFRQAAIDRAAQIMEVTGTEWSLNGYHALYVHGFVKK
ncbi:MAG TPA: hypothetical protein VKV74_17525 [Bryobacteraceae bacterium]|nr:hypothetical protein [Bryobacteraceae bacterium]